MILNGGIEGDRGRLLGRVDIYGRKGKFYNWLCSGRWGY